MTPFPHIQQAVTALSSLLGEPVLGNVSQALWSFGGQESATSRVGRLGSSAGGGVLVKEERVSDASGVEMKFFSVPFDDVGSLGTQVDKVDRIQAEVAYKASRAAQTEGTIQIDAGPTEGVVLWKETTGGAAPWRCATVTDVGAIVNIEEGTEAAMKARYAARRDEVL